MRFFIINLRSSNDRRKRMEENIKHIFAQDPSFANEAEFSFFVAHTPSDVKNTGFDKRYSRFLKLEKYDQVRLVVLPRILRFGSVA